MLSARRITRHFQGWSEKFLLTRMFANSEKQRRPEKIGIMNRISRERPRVAEASGQPPFGPIELVENVFGGADRHHQMSLGAAVLVQIEQGIGDEDGADQVGGSTGDQLFACLPRKAIAPAPEHFIRGAQIADSLGQDVDAFFFLQEA